jgi:hypothetical protein
LQNSQNPNLINPYASASRADVASMISNLRQTLALEPQQTAQGATGAAASIQQQSITIPTLSVRFHDDVSARTSNIGDKFTATTLEPVTINNVVYPIGSKVNGKVVELVRPGNNQDGALKLAFTSIAAPNGDTSPLPRDVITAQVQKTAGKKLLSRLVEFPFVWPGRMVGTAGRTIGGMTVIAGNSSEQILGEGGAALGQVVAGNFHAAGRNGIQSAVGLGQGVLGVIRTALNGAAGILNVSSDEIGYLVGTDGTRISRVLPNDDVSIAFGCLE